MGLFRVLLAISVFMAHTTNPKWIHGFGGENAVEIFFVISGFYIALILDKTYTSKKAFYKNRFLRLYPMYFIVCGLVLIRALFNETFWSDLFGHPAPVLAAGSIANSTLVGTDWMMFLQWRDSALHFGSFLNSDFPVYNVLFVPQAWSLGIEISFYLFAPLICKLSSRKVILLGASLTFAKAISWMAGLNVDPWSYRFFPFEMPIFILGILLYRLRKKRSFKFQLSIPVNYALSIALYFVFGAIGSFINIDRKIQFAVLLFFAVFVILFSAQSERDSRIGEYSYPLYIGHLFVVSTYLWAGTQVFSKNQILNHLNSTMIQLLVMLILSIGFAKLLLLLSAPVERVRDRTRSQQL